MDAMPEPPIDEAHDLLDRLRAICPFVYVATPYSKYPRGMSAAYREASRAAAWLILRGVRVFCPIAHSHPIATYGKLNPADHDIWIPADRPFMEAAGALLVVMMESWHISYGIGVETAFFRNHNKPIHFLRWPRE